MKRLLLFLTFLVMSGAAHAGDATTDLLEAPYVKDFIALSTGPGNDGKPVVNYTIDGGNSSKMATGLTFRSNGQISIHIKDFNPLTQSWTVEAKATPDVSFTAIQAFLSDLKTLQGSLPQPAAAPAGAFLAARPSGGWCSGKSGCDRIDCLTQEAYKNLNDPGLSPDNLKTYVNEASGYQGVQDASSNFVKAQTYIGETIKNAREILAEMGIEYGKLGATACTKAGAQTVADYMQLHSTADQIIAKKEALSQQIGELVKSLQPFLKPDVWFGTTTDYVIKPSVIPTFAEQQNLSVSAKVRTVTVQNGSIVVSTDDTNLIVATFVVRKNTLFVAERAAAVIYNNLKYPQYGTAKNANGELVVKRTADHQPIDGALMLNLVMRLRSPSVVYPFLQLGVSSAKDFPGFLAGLGLRFANPFNFSISAGGMITRYKDLDGNLKVGDVVTGTDDINKHLTYKTSPVVIYGAIQLKF
jgi:hypothetical protein